MITLNEQYAAALDQIIALEKANDKLAKQLIIAIDALRDIENKCSLFSDPMGQVCKQALEEIKNGQ